MTEMIECPRCNWEVHELGNCPNSFRLNPPESTKFSPGDWLAWIGIAALAGAGVAFYALTLVHPL